VTYNQNVTSVVESMTAYREVYNILIDNKVEYDRSMAQSKTLL